MKEVNILSIAFFIVAGIVLVNCSTQKRNLSQSDTNDALSFQLELNREYMDPQTTILSKEKLSEFIQKGGHPFYKINDKFVIEAALEVYYKPELVSFKTSTPRMADYLIYGKATFQLDNKPFELYIYKVATSFANKLYKDQLFLPFTDLTSGGETYGGGRYIDLVVPDDETKIVIDFNKTYHPYCAYTDGYSCPIPPAENFIDYKIEAGIKLLDLKH